MKISIQIIIEKSKDGYTAYTPQYDGVIGMGDTIEEVKKNIIEGLYLHLEGMEEEGLDLTPNHAVQSEILEFEY